MSKSGEVRLLTLEEMRRVARLMADGGPAGDAIAEGLKLAVAERLIDTWWLRPHRRTHDA